MFYSPGQVGDVLFIIKRGAAQNRMSSEGRKLVIASLAPMSFFGEMSCIGQGMYDSYAEATEDSLICTMGRADIERQFKASAATEEELLQKVAEHARHAHAVTEVSPELLAKVKSAIKEQR